MEIFAPRGASQRPELRRLGVVHLHQRADDPEGREPQELDGPGTRASAGGGMGRQGYAFSWRGSKENNQKDSRSAAFFCFFVVFLLVRGGLAENVLQKGHAHTASVLFDSLIAAPWPQTIATWLLFL